jgi:hypothetical protein
MITIGSPHMMIAFKALHTYYSETVLGKVLRPGGWWWRRRLCPEASKKFYCTFMNSASREFVHTAGEVTRAEEDSYRSMLGNSQLIIYTKSIDVRVYGLTSL